MKLNQKGLDLIKSFEGCKLSVYLDVVGITTVGYGHMTNLSVGTSISQPEADALLLDDISKFEKGVSDLLPFQINENQFSALVCFAFNVGLQALKKSTLLRKLTSKMDVKNIASEFLRWNKAGGKEIPGLTRRREAERDLFLS